MVKMLKTKDAQGLRDKRGRSLGDDRSEDLIASKTKIFRAQNVRFTANILEQGYRVETNAKRLTDCRQTMSVACNAYFRIPIIFITFQKTVVSIVETTKAVLKKTILNY